METIQSLKEISFENLFGSFSKAFADYELQLDAGQLQNMLVRRGFKAELSFGAFRNEELISFTFNGIGSFNGVKTAYDSGTGTLKDFRGQGWASRIFAHSLPFLREAGIEQYLLEVLQHNTTAVSVYSKAGFSVSRELNYYVQEKASVKPEKPLKDDTVQFRTIDFSFQPEMEACWDFYPSWQNSFESVVRKSDDFEMIGAFSGSELCGYFILAPQSGDLPQLAVKRRFRGQGIGSELLRRALSLNQSEVLKIINTDSTCESMNGFLNAIQIEQKGKQYEMTLKL